MFVAAASTRIAVSGKYNIGKQNFMFSKWSLDNSV